MFMVMFYWSMVVGWEDKRTLKLMGKKIEAKDLRCKKRQPLEKIIPLQAPFVVYIEPTNLCNIKCAFCPTSS